MTTNTYTARAGNCSVRSFYPYSVRAISAIFGIDILTVYKQWQEFTIEEREAYTKTDIIRAKMVQLAEDDVILSQAGKGGSY